MSYKVKITKYILGSLLPKNWSFELQAKQPKNLGHLYPFEFTVWQSGRGIGYIGVEVPSLKFFPTFLVYVFCFSVTVLLEYLNCTFSHVWFCFTYISLANTLSTFKPQQVYTMIVTSCTDRFSSNSIKWITL